MEARHREMLKGAPNESQERLRRAYQFWGVPYNAAKVIQEAAVCERAPWCHVEKVPMHESGALDPFSTDGLQEELASLCWEGSSLLAISQTTVFGL